MIVNVRRVKKGSAGDPKAEIDDYCASVRAVAMWGHFMVK